MQKKINKILIISYFFPPCNLTASLRTYGWAKYLKEFGYYPIIISRNWEHTINLPRDISKKTGSNIIHEVNDDYEVYYLPYKNNLRDKIYSLYGNKFSTLRKVLTLLELIFQYLIIYFIPFKNIYYFSKQLLLQQKDIKLLIISANPFISFKFGYLLCKKFKIPWIADYRDDWSTNSLNTSNSFLSKLLLRIARFYEKKWIKTACVITSVSQHYTNKISALTKTNGFVIPNGFFDEILNIPEPSYQENFTITYNGALYDNQPIEYILTSIKKLIISNKQNIRLKIYFIGTGYDEIQKNRLLKAMIGFEDYILITDRISNEEAVEIQKRSHLLLMVAYGNLTGIPSSKLYEYIALKKPVLLYPSDNDVIESTLKHAGVGILPTSETELFECIERIYTKYLLKEKLVCDINLNNIKQFSRRESTKKLSELFDKYIN